MSTTKKQMTLQRYLYEHSPQGEAILRQFYEECADRVAIENFKLKEEVHQLRRVLRRVADEGLIYWEPQTVRGSREKALMIAKVEAAIRGEFE